MLLKKECHEFNGMYATFENDSSTEWERDHKMYYNATVDDWYTEDVQQFDSNEHDWPTLPSADSKSSKKSKKSTVSRGTTTVTKNFTGASSVTTSTRTPTGFTDRYPLGHRVEAPEEVYYENPYLSSGEDWDDQIACEEFELEEIRKMNIESENAKHRNGFTDVYPLGPNVEEPKEMYYEDPYNAAGEDWDEEILCEQVAELANAYKQVAMCDESAEDSNDLDTPIEDWDVEPQSQQQPEVIDWDAGVTIRRCSMSEDWGAEVDREIEQFKLDMQTLNLCLRMRGFNPS